MNWAVLLIAFIPTVVATALHVSKKLPRFAALVGGLAVPFLIAGIPPLLRAVKHPLSPGLTMALAVATATGAVVFLFLEFFVKDHHKKRLLGRKGEPHHWRAQYATATLAIALMAIVASWGHVRHELNHGWDQTWSSVRGPGA